MKNIKTVFCAMFLILYSLNFGTAQTEKTTPDSTFIKNINATKSVYWSTAYGLKKGEGYYQNLMLGWHQYHYGLTDKFSIGFSFELISLIIRTVQERDGWTLPMLSVTPKYTESLNDKFKFGAGAWIVHIPWHDEIISLGILNAMVTYGSEDQNFTVGVGHGRFGDQWSRRPTLNFGFNTKFSNQFGMSGETWIVENYDQEAGAYLMVSAKLFGEKITFDFGFFKDFKLDILSDRAIPFIGAVFPFRKKRK